MLPEADELTKLVYELNDPRSKARSGARLSLDRLLSHAVDQRASDLIVVAGCAPTLRVKGSLVAMPGAILSAEDISEMLIPLLTPAQEAELKTKRYVDFSFVRAASGRFRTNLHFQRATLAASIRLLPAQVPTPETLHLPSVLPQLMERKQGLVLITGPTGSGKTSTLAALVDLLNARRRAHIITIEDPIEYQHANRQSIVEQIEVGHDTPSFAHAIRAVLRQNPEIILIGEMRDPETVSAALTAAETGHLVLSSLHTNDAAQTMSRILDSFPTNNQPQMRQQLSLALLAVVAQQLVPTADGTGLYPATEIMVATLAIRHLLRTGQDHQIRSAITMGRADGMMTMDQSLAELVRAKRITTETALAHCHHLSELRLNLNVAE